MSPYRAQRLRLIRQPEASGTEWTTVGEFIADKAGYVLVTAVGVADDYAEARLLRRNTFAQTEAYPWAHAEQNLQVGPGMFDIIAAVGDRIELQIRPWAGSKRCWLVSAAATISEQRIEARRAAGLVVTTQPTDQTDTVGVEVDLTFEISQSASWTLVRIDGDVVTTIESGTGTTATVGVDVDGVERSYQFRFTAGPYSAATNVVTVTPDGVAAPLAFATTPASSVTPAHGNSSTLTWTWEDGSGSYSYTLTRDDVLVYTGTGSSLSWPSEFAGTFEYVLEVDDGFSTISDTVTATVTASGSAPTWFTKPEDTILHPVGDAGTLTWTPTGGTGTKIVSIWRDDVFVQSTTVTGSVSLAGLAVGTYEFRAAGIDTLSIGIEDYVTVTVGERTVTPPEETAGSYNFATAGARLPGNGISGWQPGTGLLSEFFDSEAGVPTYPTPTELSALGGRLRWIYLSPTGSPTADGLTVGTPTTWDGFWSRVGTTFGPGDWAIMGSGTYIDNGSIKLGKNGTATNPIRVISETHLGARVIPVGSGSSLTCFAGSSYLGFHGIDFDGESRSIWGFCLGERHVNDTAAKQVVHHVDVWHCDIHHTKLSTGHISTVGTNSIHFHACDVHHSGTNLKQSGNVNEWGPFSELLYFGTGLSSAAVTDWTVDWSHLHDSPAGEAVDAKGQSHRMTVTHNLIENIRVASQAAVTRWDGLGGEIGYNIFRNIREVATGQANIYGWTGGSPPYSAPSGWTNGWDYRDTYEGAAIYAGGELNIHHNVGWDLGDSFILHIGRDVGTGMTIRNNTVGLAPKQDNTGNAAFYRTVASYGSIFRPVAFSNNLSVTASASATTAASSNFVNAEGTGLGSADAGLRRGWGYQLAEDSTLASTLGAMGKATDVIAPPPLPTGEPAVSASSSIPSGGTIPSVSGQTVVICAVSLARATGGAAIGAPAGWTEVGTAFDHGSGFRSDHRWFYKDVSGPETVTVSNANRIHYWLLEEGVGATLTRGVNDEGYNASATTVDIDAVTSTGDGAHLVCVAFHSDTGTGSGAITAPSGYTAGANHTPAYHGTWGGFKNEVSGSTSAITAAASGAGNWSTTSVVIAS